MLMLQFAPILFAALLLAAHAMRGGHFALVALSLALPALLAVRRPWAAAVLQLSLAAGAFEWARTAFVLIQSRREEGEPFLRLAAILGGVAVATALCLLVFRSRRARQHFRLGQAVSGEE
jgi:hypothetical protein